MCDNKSFHIGEQIRYYRTQKNMSQENLALAAGVNPAFVGQIERGLKSPTVNTLQKLAGALDISLAELFTLRKEESSEVRQLDIERILFMLRELNDEDVAAVAQIMVNIMKIKKK